jgi:transglutaminase-like putative cysteine protease
MNYRVTHKTAYQYKGAVSIAEHAVHLMPRSWPHHRCTSHELFIQPTPAARSARLDYFGNHVNLFTVQEPHREFQVEARSEVTVDEDSRPWPVRCVAWDEVAKTLSSDLSPAGLDAYQFVFESPRVRPGAQFAAYAAVSFPPGRPLTEAVLHLTARMFADFRFDSKATDVSTPIEEVFEKKRGVCQDFAHLQVAFLRSLNLAARYVSGYLRTIPPPGKARLVGADASHAWVSVYCPGAGWLDVDPTNNCIPSSGHITVAWGRDYGDVTPVRGIILGSRDHTLKVEVDVEPLEDEPRP